MALEAVLAPLLHSSNLGPVELPQAVDVSIRVVDRQGVAVEGATVRLPAKDLGAGWRLSERTTVTGDDGYATLPLKDKEWNEELELLQVDERRVAAVRLLGSVLEVIVDVGPPASATRDQPFPGRARIAGRIIEHDGNTPIAGAYVWWAGRPACHVVTDSRGAFSIPVFTDLEAELRAASALHATSATRLASLDTMQEVVLRLRPAPAMLTGRVVDARGRGIPMARISTHPDDQRTFTGPTGEFKLEGLLVHELRLRAQCDGFRDTVTSAAPGLPSQTVEPLRLTLWGPGEVRGRVVDNSGRAVAGARVGLEGHSGSLRYAETDSAGRFAFRDILEEHFSLHIEAQGYGTRLGEVDLPVGEDAIDLGDITLLPGTEVRGVVTDLGGQPIAGAEIFLLRKPNFRTAGPSGRPSEEPVTRTGADGSFVIEGLEPRRSLVVEVWHTGFLPETRRLIPSADREEISIELRRGVEITVKVQDPAGEPVAGAMVSLKPEGDRKVTSGSRAHAMTDRGGKFVYDAVGPGRYRFEVLAGSFARYLETLEVLPRDSARELIVTLQPESSLAGRVNDEEGQPISSAVIQAVGAALSIGAVDTTDSAGRFRLELLQPGVIELEIFHPDFGRQRRTVELVGGQQEQTFVLQALGRAEVTGVVVGTGGAPIAGVPVSLIGLESGSDYSSVTDGSGGFELRDLPSGGYSLSLGGEYFPDSENHRVIVGEGAQRFLTVRAVRPCSVVGQILGLTSEELAELAVVAVGAGTFPLAVDSSSAAFTVPSLPPGEWEFRAIAREDSRSAAATARCEDGESLAVDLTFPEPSAAGG